MLHELIEQKVPTPEQYALFFVTGDGKTLPGKNAGGDVEAASGFVLDAHGDITGISSSFSSAGVPSQRALYSTGNPRQRSLTGIGVRSTGEPVNR